MATVRGNTSVDSTSTRRMTDSAGIPCVTKKTSCSWEPEHFFSTTPLSIDTSGKSKAQSMGSTTRRGYSRVGYESSLRANQEGWCRFGIVWCNYATLCFMGCPNFLMAALSAPCRR